MRKAEEINDTVICVLKFDPEGKSVLLDYVPIVKNLDVEYTKLREQFLIEKRSANSILTYIKNNYKLNIILNRFNYCRSLRGAYQGIKSSYDELKLNFHSKCEDEDYREEFLAKERELLLIELDARLNAYYLEIAYKICETMRLKN